MSPTTIQETDWHEMAKGTISLGGINMSWDMTDGLSKEAFNRRQNEIIYGKPFMYVTKSGRIIIPSMNIF